MLSCHAHIKETRVQREEMHSFFKDFMIYRKFQPKVTFENTFQSCFFHSTLLQIYPCCCSLMIILLVFLTVSNFNQKCSPDAKIQRGFEHTKCIKTYFCHVITARNMIELPTFWIKQEAQECHKTDPLPKITPDSDLSAVCN